MDSASKITIYNRFLAYQYIKSKLTRKMKRKDLCDIINFEIIYYFTFVYF